MKPDKNSLNYKELFYYTNLVFNLSLTILFCIGLGGALGFFADKFILKKIGIFFIIGLILGVAAGFFNAYKMILRKDFFPDNNNDDTKNNKS